MLTKSINVKNGWLNIWQDLMYLEHAGMSKLFASSKPLKRNNKKANFKVRTTQNFISHFLRIIIVKNVTNKLKQFNDKNNSKPVTSF